MKYFFIETYGCQMNKADSLSLTEKLRIAGYSEGQSPENSDIIIINTCSVRKTAENRIWGRLGYYKNLKRKKDIVVAVMGCMSQRIGDEIKNSGYGVDLVVGTFFKDNIPYLIQNFNKKERNVYIDEKDLPFSYSSPETDNPAKAFVTISSGCNNFCSYCIVPYLRGREISRNSAEIIDDVAKLTQKGVIQVTLLGQNVNSYGLDKGDITFPELLKKIARETDIKWIKYLSSHPKDFTDELIEVISSEDKVANYLHLAVQSGSNNVLEKMNRKYKIETYIDKIAKLKKLVPSLNLTTDIIVGFPGETSADFQDTVNLMKTVEFDDAYMYKYNTRENTYSSNNFADDVPDEEKLDRLQTIIDLQIDIRKNKKAGRIGDIFEVIPERKSKNNQNEILGLTKEDLMIIYNSPDFEIGKIVKMKAVKLIGNSLFGERI